jgi:hypothetical protein
MPSDVYVPKSLANEDLDEEGRLEPYRLLRAFTPSTAMGHRATLHFSSHGAAAPLLYEEETITPDRPSDLVGALVLLSACQVAASLPSRWQRARDVLLRQVWSGSFAGSASRYFSYVRGALPSDDYLVLVDTLGTMSSSEEDVDFPISYESISLQDYELVSRATSSDFAGIEVLPVIEDER